MRLAILLIPAILAAQSPSTCSLCACPVVGLNYTVAAEERANTRLNLLGAEHYFAEQVTIGGWCLTVASSQVSEFALSVKVTGIWNYAEVEAKLIDARGYVVWARSFGPGYRGKNGFTIIDRAQDIGRSLAEFRTRITKGCVQRDQVSNTVKTEAK